MDKNRKLIKVYKNNNSNNNNINSDNDSNNNNCFLKDIIPSRIRMWVLDTGRRVSAARVVSSIVLSSQRRINTQTYHTCVHIHSLVH